MSTPAPVVFLVDVDNTLLDNDGVLHDLREQVEQELGPACWERYRAILAGLWDELGYRDYLGALQRYRVEHPHDTRLPQLALLMLDYPFGRRVYPGAFDVLARLQEWGPTVLLTDGDVVFQPRKVQQSGLWRAVDGRVLIYIHKERELRDVESRYPADHYVLIDDKPTILGPVKRVWGTRVTTVMPLQGQYAHNQALVQDHPPPDLTVPSIAALLDCDLPSLLVANPWQRPARSKVIPFRSRSRRGVVAPLAPPRSEWP